MDMRLVPKRRRFRGYRAGACAGLMLLVAIGGGALAQPGAQKLHPDVQRNMTSALRALEQSEKCLAELQQTAGADEKEAVLKRLRFQLDKAALELGSARDAAEGRGQAGHPDLANAQSRLSELEKRYEQGQAGKTQAATSEKAAVAGAAQAARALKSEYDRLYDPLFSKATGTPIYYNDLEPVTPLIEAIEAFEREDLPGLKARLEAFARQVGSTPEAIDAKAEADGWNDPYYRPSWAWQKLHEGISNVDRTRVAMGEDLRKRADDTKELVKSFTADFARTERYEWVLSFLEHAVRFDPDNTRARQDLAGFKAWRDADWTEFGRQIDDRRFPGEVRGAPGNAASLAASARQWFAESTEWGRRDQLKTAKDKAPRRVIAVAITGPWSVQATNLLGQPTMHGVPAKLVVALDRERELNVYRVYELTLRTAERVGVAAAPPFDSVTVGSSHYIRPAAVRNGK